MSQVTGPYVDAVMPLETENLDHAKEQSEGSMEYGNNPNLAGDNNNPKDDRQENEVDDERNEEEDEARDKSLLCQNSSDFLDDPSQFYFDDDLPTPDLSNDSNENSSDLISVPGLNTNENSNEAAALERGMVDDSLNDENQDDEQTDLLYKREEDVLDSERDEESDIGDEEDSREKDHIEDSEEEELGNATPSEDEEREDTSESEHDDAGKSKSNEESCIQEGEKKDDGEDDDDDDDGSIIMDTYVDDYEDEDQEEEEEETKEEKEKEERSIDEEGENSTDISEDEEDVLEGEEENIDEDEMGKSDSKEGNDREKRDLENEQRNSGDVQDYGSEKIEDILLTNNVENEEQTKGQTEELVANELNTCDGKDTGGMIDKHLDDTKETKAESDQVDEGISNECEIKIETQETDSLINPMEEKHEVKSPRRLRSSQARTNHPSSIKLELPDTCVGLHVTKLELDRIRLKKDLLQSRIDTLDKFLDPNIKSKEWRQGEDGEDTKVSEIRQRRPKQRRLTETEVMQRLTSKRKRPEDVAATEEYKVIAVKNGPGRPKGWRKVKEEVAESDDNESSPNTNKASGKRRKKEELLLMKALDEEMLKMDEDNTKEMERISRGLDYQCSVCSQVFIEKINLSKHFFKCLMKFTQSGRSSFKCAICFEYFSLLESLETHVSRKHSGICEEPFQCSACSLCFGEGSALKVHVLEKHDVFQCDLCSKYYRNQHTLDVHRVKKHPDAGTVKPGNTATRHTRGKGSVANTSKQETNECVKIEPLSRSQANVNQSRKKLGRPFKRKLSDDQYTGTPPVVKTEPQVCLKTEAWHIEATSAAFDAKTDENPPLTPPEENEIELGRGRRVKKKKALDYEDSISTTPGRRPNRKSRNGGQSCALAMGEASSSLGTPQTTDGRSVPHRNAIRNHPIPQPRILDLQPIPPATTTISAKPSTLVQKGNKMRAGNCTNGSNDALGPDLSTFSHSTSDTMSESIADPSEQPIQQAVESTVYLNRKVHLCPKCRKPFPNKYLVKVHMKRRHNIFKRKTVIVPQESDRGACEQTGGSEPTSNRSRSRPYTGNRETLFKCTLCDASFPTFYSLENHYLRGHEGIPCGVCRIRIKNRMLLDKHLNACHAPEERYVCPVCDKRMKSKETLRKHIVMHEDRRPYDCSVCKRSFRYSYDMRLHMRRTHPHEFARQKEEETG